MPHTFDILLLILLAASGPLVAALARTRSLAQPLGAHLEEERRIVRTLRARPSWYVYIHQLETEHFLDEASAGTWSATKSANRHIEFPELPQSEKKAYRLLEELEPQVNAGTASGEEPAATTEDIYASREELVKAASKIYSAGMDRGDYSGSGGITLTDDPEHPIRREIPPVGGKRKLLTVLLQTLGGLAAVTAVGSSANLFGTLALAVLTVGSLIWLWVDVDTMYIDTKSFALFGGGAWALALLAGWQNDTFGDALTGLLVSAGIVLFIEIINRFYRRVRHQDGMGTGDYMLIVATIGVPVAVTGSWMLGQSILITSLVLGLLGWVIRRISEPGFTRESPYAFGPYLAAGWMVATLLWAVG